MKRSMDQSRAGVCQSRQQRPTCWLLAGPIAALAALVGGCTTCEDIQDDAQALNDEFAACAAGDGCEIVAPLPGDCTGAFACAPVINAARDEADYRQRAQELIDEYADSCDQCAMASCVDPSTLEAVCDPSAGRCVTQPK